MKSDFSDVSVSLYSEILGETICMIVQWGFTPCTKVVRYPSLSLYWMLMVARSKVIGAG